MPVAEAKSVRGELGEYQRKYEGEKCTPGESKRQGDDNGDNDDNSEKNRGNLDHDGVARLELLTCDCGPSDCRVEERLELSMDFALDRPLPDAYWEIKFVVDSVNKRHEIALGATDRRDYPSGVSSMQFQVPRISVEGIMPCELANTGLLVAALKSPSAAYAITDSHLQKQRGNGREEEATLRENYDCGGGGGGTEEKGDMSGEVAAVNLVVQVSDAGRGRLVRCIYSPLE